MNSSVATTRFLLFSAIIGLSSAACRDKPTPAAESAPKAETKAEAKPAPAEAKPAPAAAKLTDAECQKVMDHVLDITANAALDEEGTKLSAAERKKQLAALRTELADDPQFKKQAETCDDEYSRSEYVCMLAATTADAIDKCNESPN